MILQSCKVGSADWLADFYSNVGYEGAFADSDDLYYAEENRLKIGVARIARENNVLVLRGMQVLKPYQNKGIGTQLLKFMEESFGKEPIYCIANDHLAAFYGKIGFEKIELGEAPRFLIERFNGYIARNFSVLVMKRDNA